MEHRHSHADRRKHHVIYKTTCKVTGKYYVWMHSTDNLLDGYIGSGIRLWKSIRKHGREQHVCEVLEHHPSREALRLREEQLVDEKLLQDPMCMNLTTGGTGNWDFVLKTRANLTSSAFIAYRDSGRLKANALTAAKSKTFACVSASSKKAWTDKRNRMIVGQQAATRAASTAEANAKRKASMKQVGHSQGSKNPAYGKCWMCKDSTARLVKPDEVELYLLQGWRKGRKQAQ